MWTRRFIVEGDGDFPIDMLRYDGCYPATSADVTAMKCGQYVTDRGKRRVTLITSGANRTGCHVTSDRWSSMGWQVVQEDVPARVGR